MPLKSGAFGLQPPKPSAYAMQHCFEVHVMMRLRHRTCGSDMAMALAVAAVHGPVNSVTGTSLHRLIGLTNAPRRGGAGGRR